jgi:hypothetical protein
MQQNCKYNIWRQSVRIHMNNLFWYILNETEIKFQFWKSVLIIFCNINTAQSFKNLHSVHSQTMNK